MAENPSNASLQNKDAEARDDVATQNLLGLEKEAPPQPVEESVDGAPAAVRPPGGSSSGPRRLGRYELLAELGAGGMANVYLARTSGPGGFSKWFAVKRIHPFLAKKQRFVDMFFDEGRIAARLQHPNVSTVFELGNEGGENFLAMEYLHGESLDQVGRITAESPPNGPPLPLDLAVWIVAQAARGLHHAHEARNDMGEPMGLVHRDVSPHNIFVGFDGQVKITDFGIAKAAGRITKTRTGGVKGKFSYMAPEQALGNAVDHRVDIFALGVVLWELTTGRRLFKGNDDAKKVMEIASGSVTPPSEVMNDYPPTLEQIVLQSLARRASKRYRTAALFAEALEGFLKTLDSNAGTDRLSAFMKSEHREAFEKREALLRDAAAGRLSLGDHEEGLGTDPTVEISHSEVRATSPTTSSASATRRRSTWLWGALGLVSAIITGGVYFSMGGPAAAPVHISSTPSGATVSLDGVERGTTPLRLPEVASGRHRLELNLSGHAPLDVSFDVGERALDLEYRLAAQAPPALSMADSEPDTDITPPSVADRSAVAAPARTSEQETRARRTRETRPRTRPQSETGAATTMTIVAEAPPADTRPAFLNLTAIPSTLATINGSPAGPTPLFRRQIPSGRVVIQLANPEGGAPRVLRLNAAPGETISRRVDLTNP